MGNNVNDQKRKQTKMKNYQWKSEARGGINEFTYNVATT
jgi:hypothetical protein